MSQTKYEPELIVGTLTLDKRQARLLSFLLGPEISFTLSGDELPIEGIERESLDDVKTRIDAICAFVDVEQKKEILDGSLLCECGVELQAHFPQNPENCEGFRRADEEERSEDS